MKFIQAVFLFCISISCNCQSYTTSFGPRIYNTIGFSLQQKIYKRGTIEFILQNNKSIENPGISLITEQHFPLLTKRFNVYMGLGPHYYWQYKSIDSKLSNPFGISMMFGLEFTLRRLNLSYDIMPIVNFNEIFNLSSSTALSLRYVMVKQKKKTFKFKNPFKKK